ncbi:aquaporin-10b isoform X1 [Colossoma macropomum]|uniref:aquaporin-10b isoform X1 n=1 Tax=Colossoma macropomum TaxID=42526 RepID=UPI001864B888|nr:aquaporin-10b isoform X1 [Colossoma macropomum]XP_036423054.1 aquaporin-10b isoform X1 [Colossoma macropomum]
MDRLLKRCHIKSQLVRECLAEFLGVYVLILFGCGSVAQVTTSENTKGEYLSINLGFALGTTFGIYVSKGVSVAVKFDLKGQAEEENHLDIYFVYTSVDPCRFTCRFSWARLPFYVLAQIFGAFLAAATVALQYYDAIFYYSGGHLTVSGATATAGIFSTYPAEYLSLWGGVVDQVIGTAALLVCVLALGDDHNTPAPPGLEPVLVGAVVMVIGISMGSNSGYAINPARDLGPRIFSCIAGWGGEVFRAGDGWWWVPLVATCVGGLVGSLIYELLIGVHHPEPDITKVKDKWQESDLKVVQLEKPKEVTKEYLEEAM